MAKIFQVSARAGMAHVIEPIARWLLRTGVTPNAVTVAGTVGVVVGAIGFGAAATCSSARVIVTLFALTDLLDGTMARLSGGSTRFGAFLDSTHGPGRRRRRSSARSSYCLRHGPATCRGRGRRAALPGPRRRSSRTSRPAPRASA